MLGNPRQAAAGAKLLQVPLTETEPRALLHKHKRFANQDGILQ